MQKLLAPLARIDAENWVLAAAAALATFLAIHAAVTLLRRRLGRLGEHGHAARPAAELLEATLARTSNTAVLLASILLGLTMLGLPPPWDQRLQHLWFIVLGIQLALYLDCGSGRAATSAATAPPATRRRRWPTP